MIVASLRPRPALPDLVRALPCRVTTRDAPAAQEALRSSGPELAVRQERQVEEERQAEVALTVAPVPRRTEMKPLSDKLHVVRMTVGPEFLAELEEVKAALSHQVPPGSTLEVLLRRCFRIALDACSRRRRGGKQRKPAVPAKHASGPVAEPPGRSAESGEAARVMDGDMRPRSRYVPVAVRREVWERDAGRCAFVGSNGKRCGSRERVELHHKVPFATGGEATAACLELRCNAHNLFEARLDFGDELMDRYTRRGRTAAAQELPLFRQT